MMRVLKSKKLLFGLVAALLIAGGLALVLNMQRAASTRKVKDAVASKDVKKGLTEGKCDDKAKALLSDIDQKANAEARGKAYEAQGLCYTYAKDYTSALESYKKSQAAFKEGKLKADADRAAISIKTSEYLINAAKAVKQNKEHPVDDNEEMGGS